jgi:lipoprotein-anchoring transpeptidase ErfK/SrfK
MRMAVLDEDLGFERPVAITYPRQGARGFIQGIASGLDREVRDATVDYSSGWVEVVREQQGREVVVDKSRRALMRTLRSGRDEGRLSVNTKEPTVTSEAFDTVLLLRIGENKLYLYEDGEITHSWTVATGQPEYPTPVGIYEVTEKRYMPTWVNPDPEGWGKDMPLSIPPGEGNPLGVRALNWSAPAIRFHGTSATYSLGYNASHGCVRLSNTEVIGLYDLIDVSTPIVSTVVAPLKPLYASAPDPTVVAEDEGEREPSSDAHDAESKKGSGGKDDRKSG